MMTGERGSVSAIFLAGCWALLLLGLVIAVDFGRFYLYREQMQAAADSAALAAVMSTTKMVSVSVERQRERTEFYACTDPDTKLPATCSRQVWEPAEPGYREGKESYLWKNSPRSYQDLCQWPYRCVGTPIWSCWLVPVGGLYGPREAARRVFRENAQWNRFDNVAVSEPDVFYPLQNRWAWDEFQVQVSAELRMPTQVWGVLGGKPELKYRLMQPASAKPVRHVGGPPC